ncbi:MAG: radical SAM family heme chaperone HemW [Bacteroidales bacterium]|nr:radical SAM family heme chaperone HemW [Bacteroidales bacterium]
MSNFGLYIHVPFCIKRCTYCSFYSTTRGKKERGAFMHTLIEEMRARPASQPISSVYWGGGTPSQLDAEELEQSFEALRTHYELSPTAEITFEANPDDIDEAKARHLYSLGVNRVSLGVQSFDNAMLRTLNRRHDAQQARAAVEAIRRAGIENVSIDLIYGLPSQSHEQWELDVRAALALDIQHLSAYALSYEPGTVLYKQLRQGLVQETDEELSLRMFRTLIAHCHTAGLEQYEISNFALPHYESRHNSSYWAGTPYIGLGPGAHSYDGKTTRRHNQDSLARYTESIDGIVPHTLEELSITEQQNEMIMTRLRTREGLALPLFAQQFGAIAQEHLLQAARPHLQKGWLSLEKDRLSLSYEGIFVSDYVMADLMAD